MKFHFPQLPLDGDYECHSTPTFSKDLPTQFQKKADLPTMNHPKFRANFNCDPVNLSIGNAEWMPRRTRSLQGFFSKNSYLQMLRHLTAKSKTQSIVFVDLTRWRKILKFFNLDFSTTFLTLTTLWIEAQFYLNLPPKQRHLAAVYKKLSPRPLDGQPYCQPKIKTNRVFYFQFDKL